MINPVSVFKTVYAEIGRSGILVFFRKIGGLPFTLRSRYLYRKMLLESDTTRRFEIIYENGLWRSRESLSGTGSTIDSTKNLRNELPAILEKYQINSILDAPCGDFNWMAEFLKSNNIGHYIGADIVEHIVESNKAKHSDNNISFCKLDITSDVLPAVDLMIVRDCLFHLSYTDIDKFLRNFSKSDIKYLLTSTHISTDGFAVNNSDIKTGDFRLIDILGYPFAFRESDCIEQIVESAEGSPKRMLLFEKSKVPGQLEFQSIFSS